jgi:hypothetical protein
MLSYLISRFFKINIGPEGLYGRCHILNHIDELGRFSRGYPGKIHPAGFNAHVFHKIFKESEFSPRIIVTFQVMAFAGMSPGHPDSVRSLRQGRKKKLGTHAPGARNPDDPDIRGIFHSTYPGKICGSVAAPVA